MSGGRRREGRGWARWVQDLPLTAALAPQETEEPRGGPERPRQEEGEDDGAGAAGGGAGGGGKKRRWGR